MEDIKPVYILTLKMDERSMTFFNEMRTLYFPREINYLKAHLTLFHHLQLDIENMEGVLQQELSNVVSFDLNIVRLINLGRGTAYFAESSELMQFHQQLQQVWKVNLTAQDAQKLRPHITVQNKVAVSEAKETLDLLQKEFFPFTATAVGVSVWEYLGGAWKHLKDFEFAHVA